MQVWITKYALTQGIYVADVEETSHAGMVVHKQPNTYPTYYHGDEWHSTFESAQNKANAMRDAKIASIRKLLARLEKLQF